MSNKLREDDQINNINDYIDFNNESFCNNNDIKDEKNSNENHSEVKIYEDSDDDILNDNNDNNDKNCNDNIIVKKTDKQIENEIKMDKLQNEINDIETQLTKNNFNNEVVEQVEKKRARLFLLQASKEVELWHLHDNQNDLSKANSKVLLLEACIHFQMAYDLGQMQDISLLLQWGDTITLLSLKYNIPPLLEQAAEKYSQASTIDPSSIECLIKWGSALSRCAKSQFILDFEYNEDLFLLAEEKFIEARGICNNSRKLNSNSKESVDVARDNSPLPTTSRTESVATITQSNKGVRVKVIKTSTPRSRLQLTLQDNEKDLSQIESYILIQWGKCILRHAFVCEEIGQIHRSLDIHLRAATLFNQANRLQPGDLYALKCWGKAVDSLGMLKILDYSTEEITNTAKDYLGTFIHTANQNYIHPPNLNPLIALILSRNPSIQNADPLNALRQISRNCREPLQSEAQRAMKHLESLVSVLHADDSIFYSTTTINRIKDVELGFAHMPPSAKKLLSHSGLSYSEIQNNQSLIISLLLFLTHSKEWPEALINKTHYQHLIGPISHLPPVAYIHKDPKRKFRNRVSIGSGGFSEVYTATYKISKKVTKHIAIKIFKKQYSKAKNDIDREIKMIQWLKHPNIVSYISSYLWNDNVWVIMDYCDGGSLFHLISQTVLEESQIAYFAKEILKGIYHLHSHKTIHRDLKSANILLYLDGTVQIGDLGLAICIEGSDIEPLPIVGSCYWLAPEVINGIPYGYKADIWSFGCILLEMANGYPPRKNLSHLRAMVQQATLGTTGLVNPENYSPVFKDFVRQCFYQNPRMRLSAEELLKHPFLNLACNVDGLIEPLQVAFVSNALLNSGLL